VLKFQVNHVGFQAEASADFGGKWNSSDTHSHLLSCLHLALSEIKSFNYP